VSQVTAAAGSNMGNGGVTVRAWIPERFCTVQVSTAGGTVDVAGITEGHLAVSSSGGPVTLGKIRSATARVYTGGGQVGSHAYYRPYTGWDHLEARFAEVVMEKTVEAMQSGFDVAPSVQPGLNASHPWRGHLSVSPSSSAATPFSPFPFISSFIS
jgi:hypothetical protein